jgi:transcription termination/antitermination protein NusA
MNDDADTVARLFAKEVPEIAAGTVEVKAVARKPGLRCKVAVYCADPHVNPIVVCIGRGHNNIKNIIAALGPERIDILRWSEDPAAFIASALQPAVVEKVILDPSDRRAKVVVGPEHRSAAEGPDGENQQLASKLTDWQIDIVDV